MNLERVKAHFEGDAPIYDDHIVRFVPYYREQNEMMTTLIPFEGTARIRGLDLGAGTGVLAEGVLRKYPLAEMTVFDLADGMLDAARHRLAEFADRVEYRQGDFSRDDFGRGYNLVLSGLSIHHLEDSGKRRLYRRIFHALRPGDVSSAGISSAGRPNAWTRSISACGGSTSARWAKMTPPAWSVTVRRISPPGSRTT